VARKLKKTAPVHGIAKKMILVGSNNENLVNSKFKSVKSLVKKFIFHVDNVNPGISGDDISGYLKDKNVDVISCFEAKSWMHFPESTDDTSEENMIKCNAFRVCVNFQDKSSVINVGIWPTGFLIREWKFKAHNNGS